jgi:hypothetical protein
MFFEKWLEIINKVYIYGFNINEDVIKWKWGGKGKFTIKLVYDHLTKDDNGFHFQHIWKIQDSLQSQNLHLVARKQCCTNQR